jgi:hypothetical protein
VFSVPRGYQGFAKRHTGGCFFGKSILPKITALVFPLRSHASNPYHQRNSSITLALARLRVRVKHLIRRFRILRIFSGRYRNLRKRFDLRFNLIAGLLNYELAHAS